MNSPAGNTYFSFKYAPGLLLLIIIGIFYYFIVRFSINIPWFDDIENIPYFLIKWIEAPTFTEKWQAIIYPNNEHRVLTARIIVLGQYLLTNKLNFKDLLFIGNLSVLVLSGFIIYSYLRHGGKWFLTIPIAFLIFNFQSYSGTFMTIMSMQYQMVILLSVASFYFLAKDKIFPFLLALFLAWVDTFSMGNGMMVWPSGLVLLLFQQRWKDSVIWSAAGAISIFLYFYGFDFVQGNDKAFAYILQYPFRTIIAFFTMLGGDFDVIPNKAFNKRMIIPTLAGITLFIVFVVWFLQILSVSRFWRRWLPVQITKHFSFPLTTHHDDNRWNAFWLGTLIYVLISMILVVVFRTRFDPHIILWSTYKMYPAVMTSVIYIIIIQSFKQKQILVFSLALLVSAGVWASAFINYLPVIKATSEARTAFAFNQKRNGVGLGATKNSAFEAMIVATLSNVEKRNIYSLPQPLIHVDEDKVTLKDSITNTVAKVEVNDSADGILNIVPVSGMAESGHKYAVLESKDNLYLFNFPSGNTGAICPKGTIRAGDYKIGIWVVSQNGTKIVSTDQRIVIP